MAKDFTSKEIGTASVQDLANIYADSRRDYGHYATTRTDAINELEARLIEYLELDGSDLQQCDMIHEFLSEYLTENEPDTIEEIAIEYHEWEN